MKARHAEELLAAQHAAAWLQKLGTAGPRERVAFVRWLEESRQNVREFLLAATWDTALEQLDPHCRVDIADLMAKASNNVVPARWTRRRSLRQDDLGA